MSRIVAFFSPVHRGATTLLAQASVRLARRRPSLRILVLDLNLTTPSVAFQLGLPTPLVHETGLATLLPHLLGQRLDGARLEAALWTYPGLPRLQILPGALDLLTADQVTPAAVAALLAEARRLADLVLVDTSPHLTSPGCLTILTEADRILLVTGPDLADRLHTRRHAQVLTAGGLGPSLVAVANHASGSTRSQLALELELPVGAALPPVRSGMRSRRDRRAYEAGLDQLLALAYPAAILPKASWWARLRRREGAS